MVYAFLCIGKPRTVLFQGGWDCNTLGFDPNALNIHGTYVVNNHGEELKAKAPP